jgi:hypothetical protein
MAAQNICLILFGVLINGMVARSLLYLAQLMIVNGDASMVVETKLFTAKIETTFQRQTIGMVSGFLFKTIIYYDDEEPTEFNFLADELEDPELAFFSSWHRGSPPELEQTRVTN